MRIDRRNSQLSFRSRRQRNGCLPFILLIGIMAGFVLSSWDWLVARVSPPEQASSEAAFNQAQAAFAGGQLSEAIAEARRAYEMAPDNWESLALLVRTLIYRSYADYNTGIDRQVALELAMDALSRNPRSPQTQAIQAYALHANGQPQDASRLALSAIENEPENIMARLALSMSYGAQGLFEAALREADRALEIANERSPEWRMDALRVQAIALSDLGRYRDALSSVDAAIRLNRRLVTLQFERALYALQIGNTDTATVSYFQVIAFDAENVKARLRLCALSSTLREREAAINYCSEVTDRAPGWAEGWYYLGREYFLQGDMRAAQQMLNRCSSLQVMQDVPIEDRRLECWTIQGQAAEILGDCDGLLATYNEFRSMASTGLLNQTWVYPPEGPAICSTEASAS